MELQDNEEDPRTPTGSHSYWQTFKEEDYLDYPSVYAIVLEMKSSLETTIRHQIITLNEFSDFEKQLSPNNISLITLERHGSNLPDTIKKYKEKANMLIVGGVKQQEVYLLVKAITKLLEIIKLRKYIEVKGGKTTTLEDAEDNIARKYLEGKKLTLTDLDRMEKAMGK